MSINCIVVRDFQDYWLKIHQVSEECYEFSLLPKVQGIKIPKPDRLHGKTELGTFLHKHAFPIGEWLPEQVVLTINGMAESYHTACQIKERGEGRDGAT